MSVDSYKTINIIATYEEIFKIPSDQCITYYFPNCAGHLFKYGITEDQIRKAYDKALAVMEMDSDAYQSNETFVYRGEVISHMRSCLLAKELKLDEQILFVTPEPVCGPGDFYYKGGTITAITAENKIFTVRCYPPENLEVPFRYVLARYNPDITEKHFGVKHAEPLFGMDESTADHFLREAHERWQEKQEAGQTNGMDMQ